MEFKCAFDELVEVHKLQRNPKNPNQHPENQINLLAKIIDYQGQRSPIVVSKRSGFIVKGHGRLDAIQLLKWDKAAVDFQDYDSEAQEFADMVADNKIAELAIHDDIGMITSIQQMEFDIDLQFLGIPDFKIENIDVKINENELDENLETNNECPKCEYRW